MGLVDTLSLVFCLAAIILSPAVLMALVVRLRRAPDDPGARFACRWLGALALLVGPLGCVGVANELAEPAKRSPWALLAVVLANVLAQPVWLLLAFAGCRNVALGLRGRVGHAWRAVREAQLEGLTPGERRSLQRFGIIQGFVAAPLGASMSLACFWPLLEAVGG